MRKVLIAKRLTMRKFFPAYCMFVLMICSFIGCETPDKKEEATRPSVQSDTTNVELKSVEKQYQYRAVCTEKEAHGGNEYVLSKWLDSRDKANHLGQYHGDFKYKGHRWRIDERVKPEQVGVK